MDGQNRNRIERFRQFRREIRGSESYLLVGEREASCFFRDSDMEDAFEAIDP